jgi:PAS domain S-box-containing protein
MHFRVEGPILVRPALVALAYAATGWLGLQVPHVGSHITLFWLPTGIAVAALVLWGRGAPIGVFLGALFVNLSIGSSWPLAAGIAVGNTLGPFATAHCLKRVGFHPSFDRPSDVGWFLVSVVAGMAVSALGGVTSLHLAGRMPVGSVETAWLAWWMGDALGAVLLAPLLLSLEWRSVRQLSRGGRDLVVWIPLAGIVGWLAFMHEAGHLGSSLAPAIFTLPLVAWAALRHGVVGAAASGLIFSGAATWGAFTESGIFAGLDVQFSQLLAWSYMASTTAMGLLITAVQAERLRTERTLRRSEERSSALFDCAPDAVIVFDECGAIDDCNSAAERLFGYGKAELRGQNVCLLVSSPHCKSHDGCVAGLLACGEARDLGTGGDLRGRRRDGSTVSISLTVAEIRFDRSRCFVCYIRDLSERVRAEEALRRSEKALSRAQFVAKVGSWELDVRANVLIWSTETYRIFGVPEGTALTYETFLQCVHPDDRAYVDAKWKAAILGEPYDIDHRIVVRGEVCWVNEKAELKFGAGNEVTGGIGTVQDITERKSTEAALSKSESLLRTIFATIPDMVWVKDPTGVYLACNRRCEELYGASEADIIGKRDCDFVSREQAELFREQDKEAIASGGACTCEQELRFASDGHREVVQTIKTPMVDADGKIIGILGISRDITERKRTEAQLQRLSQVVEQSPASIMITDTEARLEYVNEAFCRATGFTRQEAIGRSPRILQSGQTARATYEALWDALSHGHAWRGEFLNKRKDGTEHVDMATVAPIRRPDGQVTHYVAALEDVTENRRMAEELDRHRHHLEELVAERTAELAVAREVAEAANKAKSAFLANMSHEIRTPMNGIVGVIDILSLSRLSEDQAELVATVRESAMTLLRIIDDILDFSKIEADRMEIERTPVCMADLLEGLCSSLFPIAAKREVDVNLFISPEIPQRILSDEVRLRQLLYNLVGNAIKFSTGRPGLRGRVWVRAESANADPFRLVLSVADNGIGMTPETAEAIFSPFTQAELSTTRRFGGTGLGLAICKRLVSLLGGEITVQSALGAGSAFVVTLPVERAAEQPGSYTQDLSKADCVLVDDGKLAVDDLRAYLAHAGARVRCVADLSAAARLAAEETVAVVVILDWNPNRRGMDELPKLGANLRFVLMAHGRRRRARTSAPEIVILDSDVLRKHAFLRAVAMAAGLARSELPRRGAECQDTAPTVLTKARDQGRRIMVAEDDEINKNVIVRQLTLLGFECDVASDGEEALKLWREGRHALLLTDLHMPRMDGYTLAQTIRREEAACMRIPILALTANALRGEAGRALAAGIDEYLTKPVQLQLLKDALERWLSPKEEMRDLRGDKRRNVNQACERVRASTVRT